MFTLTVPFLIALFLSQRLRKFAKDNDIPQWETIFKYSIVFSSVLFAIGAAGKAELYTKWLWHIYLVALLYFIFTEPRLRSFRTLVLACAPYVIVAFVNDVSIAINKNWNYLDNLDVFTIIWMGAIYFGYNRNAKQAEKERQKRIQEEQLNKAIAQRKVELEVLVKERTSALEAQKEELITTLDELKATQAQLVQSEKMASLGELTAGIAHEIQNPLNFVNNFAEVNEELIAELVQALNTGDKEEAIALAGDIKENEQKISQHGKRADAIVKGMLLHSRTSSGQKEPTDINALADEYLRLSYHGLRAKDKSFNAAIHSDFDPAAGNINIIAQDVGRVLLNLINNAFYAVTEKKKTLPPELSAGFMPTVTVSTKKTEDIVEIKVSDNGNGVPQKVIDKIFQPFFTTKPTGQGTGLGLSLSYDIIKAHGGEIKVETEKGEGTTFIIKLSVD
jgi:two-component system NtrC family sensor kinase